MFARRRRRRDISPADYVATEDCAAHQQVNDWRRASFASESSVCRWRCSFTLLAAQASCLQLWLACPAPCWSAFWLTQQAVRCLCHYKAHVLCTFSFHLPFQDCVPDELFVPTPAHFSLRFLFFLKGGDPCACGLSAHENSCTCLTSFHSAVIF